MYNVHAFVSWYRCIKFCMRQGREHKDWKHLCFFYAKRRRMEEELLFLTMPCSSYFMVGDKPVITIWSPIVCRGGGHWAPPPSSPCLDAMPRYWGCSGGASGGMEYIRPPWGRFNMRVYATSKYPNIIQTLRCVQIFENLLQTIFPPWEDIWSANYQINWMSRNNKGGGGWEGGGGE